MQFSKDLLAKIHIKLDTEGLNSLSEKEVIVLLAEQNRDSTEFLAKQIQGGNEQIRQTQDKILTEVTLSRKTQDKILIEVTQIGQTLFGMLQTQDKMLQEMYQSRQAQEKWQQTQENKIDKLIYWAKWVIAAGGAVAASVLANLIWEAIIKG